MGFGFNLLVAFILFPLTILLIVVWLFTRKKNYGKLILLIWLPVFALILLGTITRFFTEKKQLNRDDIYGEYVIDRNMYAGKQANWQYDHFRFSITEDNKFTFYCTDKEKVLKTFTGYVDFVEGYSQTRIVIHVKEPRHHVIDSTPRLFRRLFSFYYVFYSPKYGNVFFVQGKWKNIN